MEALREGTENRVLFAGAGLTGLEAGRIWKERGFDVVIVEKRASAGGVWSLDHGSANKESRIQADPISYRALDNRSQIFPPEEGKPFSCMATDGEEIQRNLEARVKDVNVVFNVEVLKFEWEGEKVRVYFRTSIKPISEWNAVFAQFHIRTGCLCSVIDKPFPGQGTFLGKVASGTGNDVSLNELEGKRVVIVGIGPYAVENVRRSLMAHAKSVIVLCRSFNKPFIPEYTTYKLRRELQRVEQDSEEMKKLWQDAAFAMERANQVCGTSFTLNDKTYRKIRGEPHIIFHKGVPATACNHMLLSYHYGLLQIKQAEICKMEQHKLFLNDGSEIEADVVLKCFGFDVEQKMLVGKTIEDAYFVDGRPNVTHNIRGDRVQGLGFLGFFSYQGFLISFYEDQEEYEPALAAMNADPELWKAFRNVTKPILEDITDVDYFSLMRLSQKLLQVPKLKELQDINARKRNALYCDLLEEKQFLEWDKKYWDQMSNYMANKTGKPVLEYPFNDLLNKLQ